MLSDIFSNPRWYLNNLQYIPEVRVRWANYRKNIGVTPYFYVKKEKLYK
jgi:hypothetical protein